MEIPETEPIDRVPGQPEVTAWRRAARLHQHRWREAHGWPPGVQRRSERAGGGTRLIGSRIDADFAKLTGANFLNEAVRRAVEARLAKPEPHQTLDVTRLYCDLLSSMPMCFNLFGPMWADPQLAVAVTHRWFPDLCPPDATLEVGFEWSPRRRDPTWLDDRTAFDAVLHIGVAGSQRLIGIEAKYHEYATAQPAIRSRNGIARPRMPNPRYGEVTRTAGLFAGENWLQQVWGHDVEQVWRDHLLALACEAQSEIELARCVLVAPSGNPAWRPLAERYTSMLTVERRASFQYRSLEELLDAASDLLPHTGEFRERYIELI